MTDNLILGGLEAAFIDDHKEIAKAIKRLRDAPLTEVIPALSQIERTPGLPVAHFGLVAAAKHALLNPGNDEKLAAFWDRAWRIQGLI